MRGTLPEWNRRRTHSGFLACQAQVLFDRRLAGGKKTRAFVSQNRATDSIFALRSVRLIEQRGRGETALRICCGRKQSHSARGNDQWAPAIRADESFQPSQETQVVDAPAARQTDELTFDFREMLRVGAREFSGVHERASWWSLFFTMSRHDRRSGAVKRRPE